MSARAAVLALLLCAPAGLGAEEPEPRFTLFVDALSSRGTTYGQSATFEEAHETGSLTASYVAADGPAFEAGVAWVARRLGAGSRRGELGVRASVGRATRDATASWALTVPHPLYFGRPRSAAGDLATSHREEAAHVAAFGRARWRRWSAGLSAGVAFVRVDTALLGGIRFTQAYPYESVAVETGPPVDVQGSKALPELGLDVDVRLTRRLGLGVSTRVLPGSVTLSPESGPAVEVDLPGVRVGGGLRLHL